MKAFREVVSNIVVRCESGYGWTRRNPGNLNLESIDTPESFSVPAGLKYRYDACTFIIFDMPEDRMAYGAKCIIFWTVEGLDFGLDDLGFNNMVFLKLGNTLRGDSVADICRRFKARREIFEWPEVTGYGAIDFSRERETGIEISSLEKV
jgi:hypothetical protein